MISRLSFRSGALARPDVQRQVMQALARGCSSQTPIAKHVENWEKANQIYYGPERDTKNFPHPTMAETRPPVRMGMFPESWFTAIGEKTGVTGPYILGAGVITFLLSKEIWVIEHSFTEFASFWLAVAFVVKKYGAQLGSYFDKETNTLMEKKWSEPLAETKAVSLETVAALEKSVWQEEGQKSLFDVKRENVDLQLEANYRQRIAEVHTAVKKRMDYQVSTEQTKRRFEQEHMVNWIVGEVVKGITPAQEKESLTQCFKNLKELSVRHAPV